MTTPNSPTAPLKANQFSLRRLFLYVHLVSVTCSAVVGIGQILSGHDGEFRVLLTAVTVALASLCGLSCGAAWESHRARVVPLVGLALTLIGATSLIVMIWFEPRSGHEWWVRTTIVISIFAVACAHVSLLSVARLTPRYNWAPWVAFAAIFAVATMISWPVVFEHTPSEWLVRWIAVMAIIDAMMSLLIPIFHLLSRTELRDRAVGTAASLSDIDDEIARLEDRLAELRRLRESAGEAP